jgi:hypothetical protein
MFDADALAQIFIAGQQRLLAYLSETYGVSSYLMSEVEVELLSNLRINGLVRPSYQKALKSGWLKVLSASDLDKLSQGRQTEVTLHAIRTLASDLKLYVQVGEAHTHAAAILLDCPAVSNDRAALRVLEANSKPLPPTVLRSFDLFGFCFMEAFLDEKAVEAIRATLLSRAEWVPACMKNRSFVEGFPDLQCRLSTSLSATGTNAGWAAPFYLKRQNK